MNCLDLFSGTGSFKKCMEDLGFDCISLDIDGRADITCDILEWDYKQYDKSFFDVIWASPPCEKYSRLQYTWKSKEEVEKGWAEADKLVLKTLEIIRYFTPARWFIENPYTGRLKKQEFMKKQPFYIVDYCKYADWGYRKRTAIWTNKRRYKGRKCKLDCNSCDGYTHNTDVSWIGKLDDKHRIPPELIYELVIG